MRRYSFIIAVLGILSLIVLLIFSPPINVTSPSQLTNLTENQKILISGQVLSEKTSNYDKTLILDNNISLNLDKNSPFFLNKNITALCLLNNYDNKITLKALKIKIIP
jgi:hypothetical protein